MAIDMKLIPFIQAVNYLYHLDDKYKQTGKIHASSVKAALKKCFDVPVYTEPSDVVAQTNTLAFLLNELSGYSINSLPRVFIGFKLMAYTTEILQTKSDKGSVIDTYPGLSKVFLDRTIEIAKTSREQLENTPESHKVMVKLLCELINLCDLANELYLSIYNEEYKKTKCILALDKFKEELIQKTCHPQRVQWWMDYEEYQELFA